MNIATEEELMWESIKYSINEGSFKKGMSIFPCDNILFLLGGYDNNGTYSQIYEVEFNNENKEINIKLSPDKQIPNQIYFNSNYLLIHSDYENDKDINNDNENEENEEDENDKDNKIENEDEKDKKNKDIILIMDNYNGALEYHCFSGKFKYYLGK